MSAPPAHPRRRTKQPDLHIGDWFERTTDHSIHQVTNVFEGERRVQLVPTDWTAMRYGVTFDELARLYRKVPS